MKWNLGSSLGIATFALLLSTIVSVNDLNAQSAWESNSDIFLQFTNPAPLSSLPATQTDSITGSIQSGDWGQVQPQVENWSQAQLQGETWSQAQLPAPYIGPSSANYWSTGNIAGLSNSAAYPQQTVQRPVYSQSPAVSTPARYYPNTAQSLNCQSGS